MRWYNQISPAPSERVDVKCFRAAMNSESGVHVGLLSSRKLLFRDLLRIRSVAVHDPDIVAARTVARECNEPAIGAIPGLHVPREAGRKRAGVTSVDRDDV